MRKLAVFEVKVTQPTVLVWGIYLLLICKVNTVQFTYRNFLQLLCSSENGRNSHPCDQKQNNTRRPVKIPYSISNLRFPKHNSTLKMSEICAKTPSLLRTRFFLLIVHMTLKHKWRHNKGDKSFTKIDKGE